MRNVIGACACAALVVLGSGCAGQIVEPGHRGLFFDPKNGGLQHDVLQPGYHRTGFYGRIDDFDVTYSTRREEVRTTSQEGLAMDLRLAVIYRPIISELYELDTEIGPSYYDEVVGPEFRSAARGVLARHPYAELQAKNEKIEDEIEADLRRRVRGKHIEITSVTMEEATYAPEIANAVRAKLVGEQEAARQKAALENEALRKRLELQHQSEQARLRAEEELRAKENEKKMAEEQAAIDKIKAASEADVRVTQAKAEAEQRTLLAKAQAAEKRAETASLTPLAVAMHAYDALGNLGGQGTTIYLGDWSRAPRFLFAAGGMAPMGLTLPNVSAPSAKGDGDGGGGPYAAVKPAR